MHAHTLLLNNNIVVPAIFPSFVFHRRHFKCHDLPMQERLGPRYSNLRCSPFGSCYIRLQMPCTPAEGALNYHGHYTHHGLRFPQCFVCHLCNNVQLILTLFCCFLSRVHSITARFPYFYASGLWYLPVSWFPVPFLALWICSCV